MIESKVEDYLRERVKAKGSTWGIRKAAWIGRTGAPDDVVFNPHVTVWVEMKRPGGKPEPHQKLEHDRMRNWGEVVVVVDTKEKVDALIAWIESQPRRKQIEQPDLHLWVRTDNENYWAEIDNRAAGTPIQLAPSARETRGAY